MNLVRWQLTTPYHLSKINASEQEKMIAKPIVKEVDDRLLLRNVGLDYLTLSRASGTLSGAKLNVFA